MLCSVTTHLLLPAVLLLSVPRLQAQPASEAIAASPSGAAPSSAAAVPSPLPSTVLTPALAQMRQALAAVRPEKWHAPGPVNQETASNVASIQHDLDATLPGLLATADGNPDSVSEVLPAYRNIEALYDVLLRVTEMAEIVAPDPQSTALQQALRSLDDSRRALGQQLQASAVNQTRAIVALQGRLKAAQTAASAPVAAAVCPTSAVAAHRTKAKPKPTAAAKQPAATPAQPTASH